MAEPDLDNRDYARFAWARYRRIMTWMALAAVLTVVVSLGLLQLAMGPIPLLALVYSGGGIFLTIMLTAALMGLVFLSSGSGHDDKIVDPTSTWEE